MNEVNPRSIYVQNGISIRNIKSRISKLESSIAILKTRKHDLTDKQTRLDAMYVELEKRRTLQEELANGYQEYTARHGITYDPLQSIHSIGCSDGGTPEDSGRSTSNDEEAKTDCDGIGRSLSDVLPKGKNSLKSAKK